MRQAFAAATTAPHGGHVVVKEWTVICSDKKKDILIYLADTELISTLINGQIFFHFSYALYVLLTSAAVALAIQLIDR